jgi:hypothetical protein
MRSVAIRAGRDIEVTGQVSLPVSAGHIFHILVHPRLGIEAPHIFEVTVTAGAQSGNPASLRDTEVTFGGIHRVFRAGGAQVHGGIAPVTAVTREASLEVNVVRRSLDRLEEGSIHFLMALYAGIPGRFRRRLNRRYRQ